MSFELCQSVSKNESVIPNYRTAYDKSFNKIYNLHSLMSNTRPRCNAAAFNKQNEFDRSKYQYPVLTNSVENFKLHPIEKVSHAPIPTPQFV